MFEPDDPLISAYIDDELDPESRRRVEASIHDDPDAARDVRALAAISSAIGGLPRPSEARDVSVAVVRRIERNANARRRATPTFTAAAILAAAAILIATILVDRLVFDGGGPPVLVVDNVPQTPTDEADDPAVPSDSGVPLVGNDPANLVVEAEIASADPPVQPLSDRDADRLGFVLDLIEHPEVQQWEVAGVGPLDALADEVDGVLRTIVRDDPRYGRVRLDDGAPGAALGPRRSIGFAFVARPPEIRYLIDQLERAVGRRPSAMGAGTSSALRPAIAAIDTWDLRDAERAAPLLDVPAPPIAYRSDSHDDYAAPSPPIRPSNPNGAAPPIHRPRTRPGTASPAATVANAPRAVFVWVRSEPVPEGSN